MEVDSSMPAPPIPSRPSLRSAATLVVGLALGLAFGPLLGVGAALGFPSSASSPSVSAAPSAPSALAPSTPSASAAFAPPATADDDELPGDAVVTEADARYQSRAVRTEDPVRVDGVLDEPVWQEAEVLTGFVQSRPEEGRAASERTEVRLAYDGEFLYVAAVCYDRSPERIVATVLRRDEPHEDNDSFAVALDTYHDHRTGFYFETNPMGAKFDAQITGERGTSLLARFTGEGVNRDWDAVWEVGSTIHAGGWTVEVAIPFWSLRFDAEDMAAGGEVWGVNFRRAIRRRSEESYWAPIPRQYDFTRLSQAGILTGLRELPQPRNLQLKPFGIGGLSQTVAAAASGTGAGGGGTAGGTGSDSGPGGGAGRAALDSHFMRDAGLDMKWGVTPSLTLDLTFNTDFSQVEADDEQINLTRFSLFFPEKREFFLENAGLFDFGGRGGRGPRGGGNQVIGFHSRRIGLSEDNREIPLLGGARLTGKAGPWGLGFLSMQTESALGLPSSNFSVVRVRRDLASRSSLGLLFTNRQADGDDYNRQLGVDGRWAVNPHTTVDAWWMRTDTPGLEGAEWAGQVKFDWGTPLWQLQGSALHIGDHFNPEMGFVNRTGIRTYNSTLHWTPYPETGWVRNLSPHAAFVYTTDTDSRLLSKFLHLDWDVYLERGDKLSVAHNRYFEQLDFPFEIFPEVVIAPGAYHYEEWNAELELDASRPLFAAVNYTWGGFWGGDRRALELRGGGRAGARASAEVSWNRNDVELPEGSFVTDLVRLRTGIDISTRMSVAGLIQYNSRTDQVLTNVRFNFIHTPGADLFVVYNETRLTDPVTGLERLDGGVRDRALIVKVTHLLRF